MSVSSIEKRDKRKSRLGKFREKRLSYMPQSKKRESTYFSTTCVAPPEEVCLTSSQPVAFGASGARSKTTLTFPKATKSEAFPSSSSAVSVSTASQASSSTSVSPISEARPINYGVAQWEFNATQENETSIAKGDLVEVLKEDDEDWLLIRNDDCEGYVPKSYVKIIVEPARTPTPPPSTPPPSPSPAANGISPRGGGSGGFSPRGRASPRASRGPSSSSSSSPSVSPVFSSSPSSSPSSSSSSLFATASSVPQDLSLLATAPGLVGHPEEDPIGDASSFLGEGASPQDIQRFKIAKEILMTESSYLYSLSQLVDIYKAEFESFSVDPSNEFSLDTAKCIFSNVESIRALSENLCEFLTAQMKTWTSVQTIGEIFIKIAPIMIIYTEYANGYEKGLNIFKEKRRRNKHLDHLHMECKKRAGFDLDHYLIMPIQRIPRYNLLLGDLLKNTSEDHPDHQNLNKGLAACQRIATNINDCMRQTEKFKEMSDLVEKNALFGRLLQANRQLKVQQNSLVTRIPLVDGQVDGAVEKEREKAERESKDREKEKGLVLVFNDLFVYATKKSLASTDPIANSFVVPLNLVWYLGSDGVSCDVVIPGFFLSIYPDDKKETNIRTKLSTAVDKSVSEHLKSFWGQSMEAEYRVLLEKFGREMRGSRKTVSEKTEEKKDPERVGEMVLEGATLEERLDVIDINIEKLKQMMENPEENPVQGLLGEIVGDLKKGMAVVGEDPVMRSQFEDRITVVLLIKKQIPKMKPKPKPKPEPESPVMTAKKLKQMELMKFEGGKLCKEDLTTSFPYRYGQFQHPEKGEYVGWWRSGLTHRMGELKFQGNHYVGDFVNGFQQGKGVCTYFTGAKHTGKWERNMANGVGIFTTPDGDKFEGSFHNNLKHGKGEILYSNGNRYTGEWKQDLPNGAGVLSLACGLHYSGGFKEGLFEGEGELISPTGKKYKGSWVGGMREGKGVMQESDGASYAGEWHQNYFHGLGTYTNPSDGNFYAGEWVNGLKEGEGMQVYHCGDIYSGQFRMSTRLGRGCCVFSNEDFYIGQWKNDLFHGKGRWQKKNGVTFQGNFVEGHFDGIVQTPSGARAIKPSMSSVPHFHQFSVEF